MRASDFPAGSGQQDTGRCQWRSARKDFDWPARPTRAWASGASQQHSTLFGPRWRRACVSHAGDSAGGSGYSIGQLQAALWWGVHDTLHVHLCRGPLPASRVACSGDLPPESRRLLLTVSTLYVGTTTLTKASPRYIDMPTQTVLKSAKLLPVMAGSIIILGRRYSVHEWVAAAMLCAGIAIFNLATHLPQSRQTLAGSVCILIALGCDAMLGNMQQKALSTAGISTDALMLMQSAFGTCLMTVTCAIDGTLVPGLHLLLDDFEVSSTLVLWAIAITAGTALVLRLVEHYSLSPRSS